MFRPSFLLLAMVFVVELFCQHLQAQMVSVDLAAGEQLVVLKNGNVVHGFVERTATEVIVQTPQGSRLIIAADQTDFVCDSMEQAYWGKLARVRATDIEGQVQLFNWCLQHRLLSQAQNQIDILQSSRIKATRLEYLNRQLQVGFMQQQKARQRIALAKVESKPQVFSSAPAVERNQIPETSISQDVQVPTAEFFDQLDPVFAPLPSLTEGLAKSELPSEQLVTFKTIRSPADPEPSEIVQVGFENPIEIAAPSNNQLPESLLASIAELNKTTRSMPKGSLAVYRQQIENVMVARCSNCHDAKSPVMPLMHAGRRQTISRRMSQRNLHSILGFVDRQTPLSSPLLTAASTAHGGSEKASIEVDSKQYNNLRNWLIMISDQPNQAVVPIEPPPDDTLKIDIQAIKPLKPQSADRLEPDSGTQADRELPPAIGDIPQLNSHKPRFTPRDEFDPEIFNRQYVDRID